MEASRRLNVARGTVQARLSKLTERGIIRSFGPEVDPARMGYPVLAFVFLEITQGRLTEAVAHLESVPEVLEAHATSGPRDLLCRVAARDTEQLQDIINRLLEHVSGPAIDELYRPVDPDRPSDGAAGRSGCHGLTGEAPCPAARSPTREREVIKARNFCHVSSLTRRNDPCVVVWGDVDDEHIVLNPRRAVPGPRTSAAPTGHDADEHGEPVRVRLHPGRLEPATQEGGEDVIDALAKVRGQRLRLEARPAPRDVALRARARRSPRR